MTGRKVLTAILLVTIAAVLAPRPAQATDYLKEWFPSLFGAPDDDGPKPEDTLQAPFSYAPAPVAGAQSPDVAASTTDLSVPHREQKDIGDWLTRAVSEILAIDPDDYAHHMKDLATGMDATALADYQSFMAQSNILKTLTASNLRLHCYVEEQPLLLNKGVVDGRFRWLFEMPVTLTFLTHDAKNYEDAAGINQHVIIRAQVGRVPRGQGTDELMIESFEVRKNSDEK